MECSYIVNFSRSSPFVNPKIRKNGGERDDSGDDKCTDCTWTVYCFWCITHKQNGKLQLKTEAQQFTQFLQLPENISRIKMQSSMRLDTFISFCSLSKARLHFTRWIFVIYPLFLHLLYQLPSRMSPIFHLPTSTLSLLLLLGFFLAFLALAVFKFCSLCLQIFVIVELLPEHYPICAQNRFVVVVLYTDKKPNKLKCFVNISREYAWN